MSTIATTTGLTNGDFTELNVLKNGTMQNVLDLIAAGGGGGGGGGSGIVTSASLPLSISSGVLSINLGSYVTNAAFNSALANKLDTLTAAGAISISGSGRSRTIAEDLASYATTAAVNTLLTNYTNTSALNTLLGNYASTASVNTLLSNYTLTSLSLIHI